MPFPAQDPARTDSGDQFGGGRGPPGGGTGLRTGLPKGPDTAGPDQPDDRQGVFEFAGQFSHYQHT